MTRVRESSIGLALGAFLALWHVCWVLLVWVGWAQPLLDFIFQLHMIAPPYHVTDFSLGAGCALIVLTSGIGFVFGCLLGALRNAFPVRAAQPLPNSAK